MVDTFSGWPKAFRCCTNKARDMIKIFLKEIIPRFGVPEAISSDNGPHFIAEMVQGFSRFLDIKWDLHTPWRPQSSGKVERMNQTLKRQISKVCQETQKKWNLSSLHRYLNQKTPIPLNTPVHPFQPGDTVYSKEGTRPGQVDLYANWRTETLINQGLLMNCIKYTTEFQQPPGEVGLFILSAYLRQYTTEFQQPPGEVGLSILSAYLLQYTTEFQQPPGE
ncbi:hypothetical protein QYF61_002955, partial [Mycteria americana]